MKIDNLKLTLKAMYKNPYSNSIFIAIEGIDGAGTSTQSYLLYDYLTKSGEKVLLTKEPTNNIIGGLIRAILRDELKVTPECLQLLFACDRAYHLDKEILPALEEENVVISDRYFLSSIAFGSLHLPREWLLKVNDQFLLPDLTFILEVSPEVCIRRLKEMRFSLELYEEKKELEKVSKIYKDLAKKFKDVYLINGEQTKEKVLEDIVKIVQKYV